ncbi:cytidylyltransferase domain-containing protein [Mucilaginibacter ximonensis]|uniref:Cytidylyltransferase domain-containing protein n=1 Tax=Mucilaginibacter ximonensis TaxID=538021 RepID=A0ABW5YCV6_9SPHI
MSNNRNIVIIIQARMSSSRLPGKVLMPLLDKSLLARMIERLQQIKYAARLVIATSVTDDDDLIEQEAKSLQIDCFRGDLNNLLDRHYQAAKLFNADVVLKIPSDCPLIDPKAVDRVLDVFFENDGRYDFVSNLHPATWPDGNDVEVMTMACLERVWLKAAKPMELEHTTPYIWENPDQFAIANVAWETGKDYSMSHRFTIDYLEDYLFISRVYQELYPVDPAFSCEDIVALLEAKPEICHINQQFTGVNWYRHHLDELKTVNANQTKQLLKQKI